MVIRIKRVYEPPAPEDGKRFLVDRVWPRGKKKEDLQIAGWVKEIAPSDELRTWYGHEPDKWDEFRRRYFAELDLNRDVWQSLVETARQEDITLLFSSRETELNNANALKEYLERQLGNQR